MVCRDSLVDVGYNAECWLRSQGVSGPAVNLSLELCLLQRI